MTWSDKSHTLTIEARKGAYPGMLPTRKFNIVVVAAGKTIDKTVTYNGKSISVKL